MHKDDDKEIELKNNKSEKMLNIFRKKQKNYLIIHMKSHESSVIA